MNQCIIDLSRSLYDGMRGVKFSRVKKIAEDGVNLTELQLNVHSGTHMDAPLHFLQDGGSIDRIDLNKCIGPALVIDLSDKTANSQITVEDLAPYESDINPNSRLLLRTDWSRHDWNDPIFFTDMPCISVALAHWFVEKHIGLLGLETPAPWAVRPGERAELTEVHRILLKERIALVEGLANLSELSQKTVHLIVLPLKLEGCEGTPVRAVAIQSE
jgi:kynurenine formamidase